MGKLDNSGEITVNSVFTLHESDINCMYRATLSQ